MSCHPSELMAIVMSRDIRADDRLIQSGANLPEGRAAAILAGHRLPDARVIVDLAVESFAGGHAGPPLYPSSFDPRTLGHGEARMRQHTIFDDVSKPEVFFVGALEIDRRGNLNLLGRRDEHGRWAVRGPGALGVASMVANSRGYYVVMRRHEPRSFVERVALVSALGDREARRRAGLLGGGTRLVVSPLGVFDFDAAGDMRLRSLHEGVTPSELATSTGFELAVPEPVPRTQPPAADELRLLREVVDPDGTLRGPSPSR